MSGLNIPFLDPIPANSPLTANQFFDIAKHWQALLVDSGAVVDSPIPIGGKTPRQWIEEHLAPIRVSQSAPLAGSVEHALLVYHTMDLWQCLCDGDMPRLPEHRYSGDEKNG